MVEGQPIRVQLREQVYNHVLGDRLQEGELELLVEEGEKVARLRSNKQLFGLYNYSPEVRVVLDRLNLKALNDEPIRKGARALLKSVTDNWNLKFYVGIMRLGLGSGIP